MENITEYAGYTVKPKLDFGSGPGHFIGGRYVKEGFNVLRDGCNVMPGAAWFQTVEKAERAIDVLEAVGCHGERFWHLLRAIHGPSKAFLPDTPTPGFSIGYAGWDSFASSEGDWTVSKGGRALPSFGIQSASDALWAVDAFEAVEGDLHRFRCLWRALAPALAPPLPDVADLHGHSVALAGYRLLCAADGWTVITKAFGELRPFGTAEEALKAIDTLEAVGGDAHRFNHLWHALNPRTDRRT